MAEDSPNVSPMVLRLDAPITIQGDKGRVGALGAIAVDQQGRFWGLTSSHLFDDIDSCEVHSDDGAVIGRYTRENTQQDRESRVEAISRISRFEMPNLSAGLEDGVSLSTAITWPTFAISPEDMGGLKVVPVQANKMESDDPEIGRITTVGGAVKVKLDNSDKFIVLTEAVIVELSSPDIVAGGRAGTTILSESGDLIGLAVAVLCKKKPVEIVVAPVEPLLRGWKLELWAPPGVHWSDLTHKVARILAIAEANEIRVTDGLPGERR